METEIKNQWADILQAPELTDKIRGELSTVYGLHNTTIQDRDFWKAKYITLKEVYAKSLKGRDTSLPILTQIDLKVAELAELRTKL